MLIGTWNLSEIGADDDNDKVVDADETVPAALIGASGTLKLEGNGNANLTINFLDTTSVNGVWDLLDNENTFRLVSEGDTALLDIAELTSNRMSLRMNDEDSGSPIWYIMTK